MTSSVISKDGPDQLAAAVNWRCSGSVAAAATGVYAISRFNSGIHEPQLVPAFNCGSCIPELKRLIAQTPVAAAATDPEQRQLTAAAN